MRDRIRSLTPLVSLASLCSLVLLSSCAGKLLEGKVGGTQTRLQDTIANGSKTIGCAPKETALAEANVKFAEEALKMGEYYRGKEHVILAGKYTEIAELKTDPVRCRAPGNVTAAAAPTAGDRDGDGYDDDLDGCPDDPEDFDAFEDEDGCPDKDNDGDGVEDASALDENRVWINLDQKDKVDCRNDPEDPDGFEDEDGCPDPDNDQDGILDGDDTCPNDPEDFDQFEDEDGCPEADNDKDGILDGDDSCPNDPEDFDGDQDEDGCPDLAVKVDPCAIKLDDKVLFDSNKHSITTKKADVSEKNHKLLDDVVTVLNNNPDITIEIGGHTDSKGSDKNNKKLSQRRVDSVRDYLVSKGIAASRVATKGYGEDVPVDSNLTKEGREANRRVEFNRTDNPACFNK
ncbi:OmpA family protein [Enhygromyxa salina]|uniref:Outer membrane porin F n=1 Tax=Enhygromyxa salina TaxID=215803 RepID=A0A2S9Y621_9BACT|nr:OmpA family protein [Enhygromyxa salina]PRQ00550.1 Outer membrane porin F precursor [Enhygromyxa salina]